MLFVVKVFGHSEINYNFHLTLGKFASLSVNMVHAIEH